MLRSTGHVGISRHWQDYETPVTVPAIARLHSLMSDLRGPSSRLVLCDEGFESGTSTLAQGAFFGARVLCGDRE